MEYLLSKNADINHRDLEGRDALFISVTQNHLLVVKHLLNHKADVNSVNSELGLTPLIAGEFFKFQLC